MTSAKKLKGINKDWNAIQKTKINSLFFRIRFAKFMAKFTKNKENVKYYNSERRRLVKKVRRKMLELNKFIKKYSNAK